MIQLLALLLLLVGCGRPGDTKVEGTPPFWFHLPDDLVQKRALYLSLVPEVQDQWGFIQTDKCDSLLFSSLIGASGAYLEIRQAEDPGIPGRWYRRPNAYEPCFIAPDTENGSKSTISRDMLLGVMWYGWVTRDLSLLTGIYAYGEANNWIMGDGIRTRTGFRTLRSTLAIAIEKLGGNPASWLEESVNDPNVYINEDYAGHLQALHIALRGEIYGRLSESSIGVLRKLADVNRGIPFFQAVAARWTGEQRFIDAFIATSRNEQWFPSDRLPESSDRCSPWFQDQLNPLDTGPCGGGHRHSGGDLLFALFIYSGLLR